MRKWNILLLMLIVIVVAGCNQDSNAASTNNDSPADESDEVIGLLSEEYNSNDVVATIQSSEITGQDIDYEIKRLELMKALQNHDVESGEKSKQISPSVALQEILERRMIRQIALEENIEIDEKEQEERLNKVREDVESKDIYQSVMDDDNIEEEVFWARELDRYEIILETEEIIDTVIKNEKAQTEEEIDENKMEQNEQLLNAEAITILEGLIQEELAEADIEIMN